MPLNALHAFGASARHLSFTRAAIELYVIQAAVSHQVRDLEERLGVALFKRLPHGLMLTHEGESLLPALCGSFDRIAGLLKRFGGGHYRDALTASAVGIFTVDWLLPQLEDLQARHPFIDLRLSTRDNRVGIAAGGPDCAIHSGGGAWHNTEALALSEAPLTVLCYPEVTVQLHSPADLLRHTLLHSYHVDEWPLWFQATRLPAHAPLTRSITFDTSLAIPEAARRGVGMALAPAAMFVQQLASKNIRRPFATEVSTGGY